MQSVVAPQGGYAGSRRSPIGLGGTIAVHAVAVGIFLLMPREMIEVFVPPSILTYAVPADPPPPDPVQPPPDNSKHPIQQPDRSVIPVIIPKVALPVDPVDITETVDPLPPIQPKIETPADPPRAPVFAQASPDPRFARDLQPAYPPSMQRMDMEGSVTVRVRIGADGRVLSVEKLSAASDAFWDATREQALRKWRFRPGTRDGTPVESERVMTVHFRMT
ncbi:MAG: energy transducer TonB [Sphingobium phenoxybenzoativorans]